MWTQNKSCESLKRDNDYLQSEVDDYRRREEERIEKNQRAERERREERQREYQESLCHAEDWPEAFRKGLIRMASEAAFEETYFQEFPDERGKGFSFANHIKEVERAEEVYDEVMADVEKQIQALREGALDRIADKLEEEGCNDSLVEAFREDNPEYLTYW
jgi:hypothetical protein